MSDNKVHQNWWLLDSFMTDTHCREVAHSADCPILYKALIDKTVAATPSEDIGACLQVDPKFLVHDPDGDQDARRAALSAYTDGFVNEVRDTLRKHFGSEMPFHPYLDDRRLNTMWGTVRYAFPTGYFNIRLEQARQGVLVTSCFALSDNKVLPDLYAVRDRWSGPVPVLPREKPDVFGFSMGASGPQIVKIGKVNGTLERGNYRTQVMNQFDRVVSELKKEEPAGRLVLMDGEPGTGKTYLIRALIGALMEDSACVIVPPSLMDNLSGPEFLMSLIRHRDTQNHPLTLILEDADNCLIDRERQKADDQTAKNLSNLSALLNLSDGILGATLNLRVVATTNQQLQSVDKAVLRPGRLLEHIHVGGLDRPQAYAIYRRLTDSDPERNLKYKTDMTLAEVYEAAQRFLQA